MDKSIATIIGKDVIESLTIGMYEDSRFIYREYIQNAADQIDKAVREKLIEKGEIHISIDSSSKSICIEDNATGIAQNQVLSILKNIAQSTKQRGVDKGFRGIGRLGGLGYCNELIFETSFKGEATKSIMVWDATLLKNIINNRKGKEEASRVIDEVTSIKTEKEKVDSHYFKVILTGIINDDLLNISEIREYLSMVAPVPLANKFIFRSKIYEELKTDKIIIDEYNIFINEEQLFKAYTPYIYEAEGKAKTDEIFDVLFIKERAKDGNWLFWGWYGISSFKGRLKKINSARGLRLRKSNIQVGDENTLSRLHKEPDRGNFYFFGELHGIHPDLIPNSRRDYFTENDLYLEFEQKVKSIFYNQLHKLYYNASDINSAVKKIEELHNFQKELEGKKEQGFTDKKEQQQYFERFEKKKVEARKAESKLQKFADTSANDNYTPINRILEKVTSNKSLNVDIVSERHFDSKPKYRTDNLSRLNKEQRKFLGHIFGIIKNVLPQETAENLIRKIEEEFKWKYQ